MKIKQIEIKEKLKPLENFLLRWSYFLLLIVAGAYASYIFYNYIFSEGWSEEEKAEYVEKRAVFSFDREQFEDTLELMEKKQNKTENSEIYSGKDIFFPEGF